VWRSPPVLAGGTGSRYDRPDRFVGEPDGMKKSAGPGGDWGGVAGSEIGEGWPADERGATWAGGRDQLATVEGPGLAGERMLGLAEVADLEIWRGDGQVARAD
jgi:hypothetical protein